MELFCEYRHVEADKEKTESVIRTIQQKISFRAYQMVYPVSYTHLDVYKRQSGAVGL